MLWNGAEQQQRELHLAFFRHLPSLITKNRSLSASESSYWQKFCKGRTQTCSLVHVVAFLYHNSRIRNDSDCSPFNLLKNPDLMFKNLLLMEIITLNELHTDSSVWTWWFRMWHCYHFVGEIYCFWSGPGNLKPWQIWKRFLRTNRYPFCKLA